MVLHSIETLIQKREGSIMLRHVAVPEDEKYIIWMIKIKKRTGPEAG